MSSLSGFSDCGGIFGYACDCDTTLASVSVELHTYNQAK